MEPIGVLVVSVLLAVSPSRAACPAASWAAQPVLTQELSTLRHARAIDDMKQVPSEIRTGTFLRPAGWLAPEDWDIANPGQPFRSTDMVDPQHFLPYRRLVFAVCGNDFCFLAYDSGGIVEEEHLVAFKRMAGGEWMLVWHGVRQAVVDHDTFTRLFGDFRSGQIETLNPCQYSL